MGAHLRALREAARASLRRCAKALGISPTYLSDIELGKRSVSLDFRDRMRASLCRIAEEDQEKTKAYALVAKARRRGELSPPPQGCTSCGDPWSSVNRPKAHHRSGYAEEHALDVEWLCSKCHGARHDPKSAPAEADAEPEPFAPEPPEPPEAPAEPPPEPERLHVPPPGVSDDQGTLYHWQRISRTAGTLTLYTAQGQALAVDLVATEEPAEGGGLHLTITSRTLVRPVDELPEGMLCQWIDCDPPQPGAPAPRPEEQSQDQESDEPAGNSQT